MTSVNFFPEMPCRDLCPCVTYLREVATLLSVFARPYDWPWKPDLCDLLSVSISAASDKIQRFLHTSEHPLMEFSGTLAYHILSNDLLYIEQTHTCFPGTFTW